jgi:hypothetical protein
LLEFRGGFDAVTIRHFVVRQAVDAAVALKPDLVLLQDLPPSETYLRHTSIIVRTF